MDYLTNWAHKTKDQRQESLRQLIDGHDPDLAHDCIRLVSAGHHGVYASMGPNFTYAVFGRDSIEVAEDLLATHQSLARDIIFTLARLQGVKYDNVSEEEPGKIHHEYRSRVFEGELISEESLAVMHKLQRWWGSIGADELVYYGSFDATPLYVRLVTNYTRLYGKAILGEKYVARDGQDRTILDCLQSAIDWLTAKIEQSPWRLLEYKRINPSGLLNQVWKDSGTSYLHIDGTIANADGGIAAVELQGYAYDALLGAAQLFDENNSPVARYRDLARDIQQATLEQLWMPDSQFFAQGLDRDETNGSTRQIKTLTSNAGLLLYSQLLKDLPDDIRRNYCEGIIKTICGPEFLTEAGIRCRALRHKTIPGFVDYHGTYAVWPKETFDIASGLLQHGYAHLAQQLNNRILNSVEVAGDFYELFYVEDDGTVWYDPVASVAYFSKKFPTNPLPVPEPGQAWVISAVINILSNRDAPLGEETDFGRSLRIPNV
jgi:glycogen debranching enzyme